MMYLLESTFPYVLAHVPASFGGDTKFVTVHLQVGSDHAAETLLDGAVVTAGMVAEVELGDAEVEGVAQKISLGVVRYVVIKIPSQAQSYRRKDQSGVFTRL